jgi:hypothetical protein
MQEALEDLNKVLDQAPSDKVAIADRECLNALKTASGGSKVIELDDQKAPPQPERKDGEGEDEEEKLQPPQIILAHEPSTYMKAVQALGKLIS